MKQKVTYSRMAIFITIFTLIVLAGVNIWILDHHVEVVSYIWSGVIVLLFVLPLFYAPVSVEVTSADLIVNSPLRKRVIPIASIVSVRSFDPRIGSTIRICGSGGFFGWWGSFNNRKIGRFTACYGDSSRCLLVKLLNGKKFVLSCADPSVILSALNPSANG